MAKITGVESITVSSELLPELTVDVQPGDRLTVVVDYGHRYRTSIGMDDLLRPLKQALGDKSGIRRYGFFTLPMEETLCTSALDLSGRYYLVFNASFPSAKIGDFDSELVEDFWQAFAANALCNLHVNVPYGRNSHHVAEAIFKATARALRMAAEADPRMPGVPSTKGTL